MSDDDPKGAPRRDFLNLALGGTAVACGVTAAYPVLRYLEPPARAASVPIDVGRLETFPIGGARTVLVDERPVIVLRATDGSLRAFSAICTHLQCVVAFSAERNQIECGCHRGVYSLEGRNLEGPPPKPLDELLVVVSEGSVIVSTP
jgi:Rieske Fe-S protein